MLNFSPFKRKWTVPVLPNLDITRLVLSWLKICLHRRISPVIIATNATISTQKMAFLVLLIEQNAEKSTIMMAGCHNPASKYSAIVAQPMPKTAPM
jgi:hypothetical protein